MNIHIHGAREHNLRGIDVQFGDVYFLGYWMLTQLTRLGYKLFTEFPTWVH